MVGSWWHARCWSSNWENRGRELGWPHLLTSIPIKEFHSLVIKHSNIWAHGGQFLFRPLHTVTCTILPQGFWESPHLFAAACSWGRIDWTQPQTVLLRIDCLVCCGNSKGVIFQGTESFWNLLGKKEVKVFQIKTKLYKPNVMCLGLTLKKGTRALWPEWLQCILNFL